MPQHARPGLAEAVGGVREAGQPLGGDTRALGGIGQELVRRLSIFIAAWDECVPTPCVFIVSSPS